MQDPSVPPYAAPPGWQPPPPPYGTPAVRQGGWHGAGPGTVANAPVYPPPQSAHTVGGYEQPYGYQPYGGYPEPRDTNGFAIASLVSGLIGIFALVIGPLLGIIFGFVALRQLERSRAGGRNLAMAGIVVSGAVLLFNVGVLIAIAQGHTGSGGGDGGLSTLPAVAGLLGVG